MTAAVALEKPKPVNPDDVLLPHNLEAERACLGAALVHHSSADYISDKLLPEHFFRRAHQDVFKAIRSLRDAKQEIDFVTLKNELARKKRLDDVGGPAYISGLADGVPRATNVPYYAGILKDLAAKRALVELTHDIAGHVVNNEHPATAIIAEADRRLLDLQRGHADGRMRSLRDSALELFNDLEWRTSHRGQLTGIETGFQSINDLTLGWQAGDMDVIAARPSIGKTTLAMNSAVAAAQSGKRVAIFSLEMKRKQLEYRILSQLSQIPLSRILAGLLTTTDYARLSQALEQMNTLPIEIDDRAAQTVLDVRHACRRLRADGGLDLVVVDYLGLMPGVLERKSANKNDQIEDTVNRLKALADDLQAPVLVLSQLKRIEGVPKLDDLRDSGSIEQVADVVVLLHRKNHRASGLTEGIFAKQRNGATGTVKLNLDRDTTTFTDAPDADEPAEPEEEKPRPSTRKRKRPPSINDLAD